jgi:hypothetical protein
MLLCLHKVTHCQGTKGFQVLVTLHDDLFGIVNKDENGTGGIKIELITPRNNITALPFFTFKDSHAPNLLRFSVGGTSLYPHKTSQPLTSYFETAPMHGCYCSPPATRLTIRIKNYWYNQTSISAPWERKDRKNPCMYSSPPLV